MRKKIRIILFFMAIAGARQVLPLQGLAFAQLQDDGQPCPPECVTDSMEIVTWYPSPYNEYEELRLYPISESNSPNGECGQDNRGLMYYDKDDDKVYICKGAIEGWKELGGSGNLPQSTTSSSSCDSNNLGKLIYDTSRNRPYVCALNGSSYVWKPLDSDYDEDGVTDAVDANDNDFNDATAVEANVESGKTFYARGDSRRTGTMIANNLGGVCYTVHQPWAGNGWSGCSTLGSQIDCGGASQIAPDYYSGNPCRCLNGYVLGLWLNAIADGHGSNNNIYKCTK